MVLAVTTARFVESMPVPSASGPGPSILRPGRAGAPARTDPWAARAAPAGPDVAVLITDCDDVAAAVRGYRTMLPRARVFLYGHGLSPDAVTAAECAGAVARSVPPSHRGGLLRRMFTEVEADVYVLAHRVDGADVCVVPLMVAEIDGAGRDLVTASYISDRPARDRGDRLLAGTVDFLFGQGGDALGSDFKACSRRFALSYRSDEQLASALDLTLHALRLRMPVGEVAALGRGRAPAPAAVRGLAGWAALLRLVGRLLAEERPRRVFGLVGLAIVAAGIAAGVPAMKIHHWRATLPQGAGTLLPLALMLGGGAVGAAGILLDVLAKARQEVKRLGYLAIPRRAEPR